MECIICGCQDITKKRYNNHLPKISIKARIKNILPFINFLIPNSMVNLKKLAVGRKYFKGNVFVCKNCGHGFLENPPEEQTLVKYYKEAYWNHRGDNTNNALVINNNFLEDFRAKTQLNLISPHINFDNLNNVLEIGAGPANASQKIRYLSKNDKLKIFVYEPGTQWVDYYRNYAIEKIADYFPSETNLKFDYIHTSHWLEHTRDINTTLTKINDLLVNGGFFFVEIPNEEHHYWDLQLEDTPHLHFFTRKSLETIMRKHNFDCVTIGEYGISYLDRLNGKIPNFENSKESAKGFWIRALFKKL